ncbi:unnamed protein product, partial [marine sediment metagenome]
IYNINGVLYKFTTAAFAYYEYDNQELKRKDYREDGDETWRWYWRTTGLGSTGGSVEYEHDEAMEVLVDEDGNGDFWADLREADKKEDDAQQAKQADVDEDGKEELVLKVSWWGSHPWLVTGFYVLDSQEGQIDTSYEGPDGQKQ